MQIIISDQAVEVIVVSLLAVCFIFGNGFTRGFSVAIVLMVYLSQIGVL
ncbi:hypothetical protein Ah1_00070 [Aeromonas phage Ah1]|uniref:Uncharacterized protein n=1 Tax=Aeromonas phage Ah1 TaxID=2053701 RepID=A0A2H4YEL6_9CAUD|nr:hypothetical protein KNT77_gp070 [Aeromonas phage Ah1]AUE22611.1 hypothetical protein Ah1_00070 [Aeromonas phage Ah1]UYD60328.1 hypothetical protein OPFAMLBM_00329 [Aeromonas phage avDM12-TAAL]